MTIKIGVACTMITLFLFSSIPIKAETNTEFSLKAALTFSRPWNNEIQNDLEYSLETNYKMGFALGASVNFKVNPHVTLQPEILYTRKGAKQTITTTGILATYLRADYSMDYIEIPVLVKFYMRKNHEPLVPFVGLGPYVSFLIRDKYKVKAGSDEFMYDSIEDINKFDYGITLALGLDFNGPGSRFVFDYRLSLGLAPICLPTLPGLADIECRNLYHMFFIEIVF